MRQFTLLLGLAGIFLGWNAPNHYPPWPAFHLEMFAALGLCLIAAAVLISRRAANGPHEVLAAPRAAWGFITLATLPLLQFMVGQLQFRADALIGALYALGVALALYVGALWTAQAGRGVVLRALFGTLVIAAIVACGLATAQWLRLLVPSWMAMELIDARPFANFAQPNHLGLAMVMGIVSATALYELGTIRHAGVWRLLLAWLGWGAAISQSRAAALALVVIVLLWLLTRRRTPSRLRVADLLLGVVFFAVLAGAIEPLQQALVLAPSGVRLDPEVGPRHWIWLHFWAAIQQHPWVGFGFNQAVMALASVSEQVHPSRNVIYAHNFVLDLMAWFGIPLALLATAAVVLWLAGWMRRADDPALGAQRHLVLAVWVALLVQSLLEYPFAHTYFLLPCALLAGAVTPSAHGGPGVAGGLRVVPSRWMQGLAAGSAVIFATLVWEYFHMESDFRFNRFDRANFSTKVQHESMAHPWVLDHLGALNASAQMVPRRGMPPGEISALEHVAHRFHIVSTRLDYAKALALNGRRADAQRELTVIRSISPPREFARIESFWRSWQATNGLAPLNGPGGAGDPGSANP
jgi:O-antigen ligase